MNGLEQRRELAVGVEVGRGGDPDRPGQRRSEVGQDVAEQVGADDHVEVLGAQDELGAEVVDVELIDLHVGIALGHRPHAFVPVGHRDRDPVGLGGRGEVVLGAHRGEIEGVAQDPIDADAGHHRLLDDDLALGAGEHAPAELGVLALGVLPHDEEVDVAGVGQPGRDARHQPYRTQVDVLIERAADLEDRAPQRDVVGHHLRPAHGAEEDRVVAADRLGPVGRHHHAVLGPVRGAGEGELVEGEREAVLRGRGLEHAPALGDDLDSDAVAGDGGDAKRGHAARISLNVPRLMLPPDTMHTTRPPPA